MGSAGVLWSSMHDPRAGEVAAHLGLGEGFAFGVACWPVYQMLCGMSLELLLKAVIVAQEKEPTTTHELDHLASQAGLSLSDQQTNVLRLLSGSVIWEGRYPVPKAEKHFASQMELHKKVRFDEVPMGNIKVLRRNGALSWDHFRAIWGLVYAAYEQASS